MGRLIERRTVWLHGGWPIRRRWRLLVRRRVIVSLPIRSVAWSRKWDADQMFRYRRTPVWRYAACRLVGHRPALLILGRPACGRCGRLL